MLHLRHGADGMMQLGMGDIGAEGAEGSRVEGAWGDLMPKCVAQGPRSRCKGKECQRDLRACHT